MKTLRNAVLLALGLASPVMAQQASSGFPNKPIRLIVPFSPGGSSETIARTLGQKMAERVGQQIVLDNRAGGNGTIGTGLIASSPPDGYTIGIAYIATMAINAGLYTDLPYDPSRDFSAITQLTSSPNVIAVHPTLAANSVKELVALAKAKPDFVNYASGGVGTIGHLSGELMKSVAGIKMQHIVYKGSGQAVIDVLGGHVPILIGGMSAVLAHARAGKLRLIGVTSLVRAPIAPEVPTIAESGYPGFEAVGWFGLIGPKNLPPAILKRLNEETIASVNAPEAKGRLEAVGFDVVTSKPDDFLAYIRAEATKWKKLVKDIGLKL
jgi:tripartite-type tricarboxylate transporter receptor subunit TctC